MKENHFTMTERTEGIKEGLEMAAKWHVEKAKEYQELTKTWRIMGANDSEEYCRVISCSHKMSAEILRAKIEEVE